MRSIMNIRTKLTQSFMKLDLIVSGQITRSVANSLREVKCNGPPGSFAMEQAAQKGREPAKKQIAKGWHAPLGRAEVPAQWTETSTDILFWAAPNRVPPLEYPWVSTRRGFCFRDLFLETTLENPS